MADVRLVFARLDDDRDIALGDALSWLAPDEMDRAARFRFERVRARYIRARGLLRRTLGETLGMSPQRLAFTYGDTGKPGLEDSELAFNLSHSAGHAVIAHGGTAPLGVDIEALERTGNLARDLDGLARRCFNPTECAAIDAAPDTLRHFLVFWTAKEARMKLTGEGLWLDPQAIRLRLDQNGLPTGYDVPSAPAATLRLFETEGAVGALAMEVPR